MELSFRRYFELVEVQPNYLDALRDELGIDPEAFEKNPQWAANVSVGNLTYNGIQYQITRFVKNGNQITGAMIKPLNVTGDKTQRAYLGSNKLRIPDSSVDSTERFIPKAKLMELLTQGMASGSSPGGLPGSGF